MKYKEFVAWCSDRAADGCWSFNTAVTCIGILRAIDKLPFWKRAKEWQKINNVVERDIVAVIEEKMKEQR